jgi:putative transposase
MARKAREKAPKGEAATYHLRGVVAAFEGEFPLQDPEVAEKYREILFRWSSLYFCEIIAYATMGNHPHDVCHFEAFRVLSREELQALAERFYPKKYRPMRKWDDEKWEHFNERVFDVSEFMRNVRGEFATWYNRTHNRRGHFWGDRFQSRIIEDHNDLVNCVMYVESNPIRPELVERPEDWPHSSARLRYEGKDEALTPITTLLGMNDYEQAVKVYRELLLSAGMRPSKKSRGVVSQEVFATEQAAGFITPGILLRRDPSAAESDALALRKGAKKRTDELQRRKYNVVR